MKFNKNYFIGLLIVAVLLALLYVPMKNLYSPKQNVIGQINKLPKPVIIRDITKGYAGKGSFVNMVKTMLVIDGEGNLHYFEKKNYDLYPFFCYTVNDTIK